MTHLWTPTPQVCHYAVMQNGGRVAEGKRVALYARVSTADQTAENQLLDLRKHCAARGWTIVKEFVDIGISGAKKDRPALQELMVATFKREVDGVLVWRFDRFARSMSHLVNTLEEFNERGISFTSVQEGIDTATAQGKLVFGMVAALAEFERQLIIERIIAGLRRARSEGKIIGRPGLSKSTVAEILALRGKASTRQIAARLGIGKSVVHKVLSINPEQNVALSIDEAPVAF